MAVKINIDGVITVQIAEYIEEEVKNAKNRDLKVLISSPGGLIFPGLKIFNIFNNHTGNVHIHLIGLVAGIASAIAMAGDKITAEPTSVISVISVCSFPSDLDGQCSAAIVKHAFPECIMDFFSRVIAVIYSEKTNKSIEEIIQLMDAETYFVGSEMKDAGFIDCISRRNTHG